MYKYRPIQAAWPTPSRGVYVHEGRTLALDCANKDPDSHTDPGIFAPGVEMPEHCWKCGHSSSTTSGTPHLFSGVPTSEQSTPVMSDANRLSKIAQSKGEEVTLKARRKKRKKKKDDETS